MDDSKRFPCSEKGCPKHYSRKDALQKHMCQKHEQIKVAPSAKLMCYYPNCGQRFLRMVALCNHVQNVHNQTEAVVQEASFQTYKEFTEWRIELEHSTQSKFVQHDAAKRKNDSVYRYFFCHRSGQMCHVPLEQGKRKRAIKSQGLCKLTSTCTAYMAAAEDVQSKAVNVSYCLFHTGHTMDLGHLHLSNDTCLEVAGMLQQGVTMSKIMDTMRDRLGNTLHRDDLLTRRDIHNVKMQFNIGCIQKDNNDHTSVDIWIQELQAMGEASPVLLYKRQGHQPDSDSTGLSESDFILCIQTITQRQSMLKFGNNSVACLDSTHATNQYGFNLITLMVVDDFGEGCPVAFMISTKEDFAALSAFFTAMKAKLPADTAFTASHVMTDDASQYHNAWVSVFGPADKRLCVWHVDRAWRKAIKEHVSSHETQVEIYHMLRSVMQELELGAFQQCLSSLMAHLNQVAPRFAQYFQAYCNRVTEWAYCYRKGTQANTNMYLESFHNVLKTTYMERKANRRVDTLLNVLLKIARDKAFERLIKVEKQSHSKKLTEINKRHSLLVQQLPPSTDGGWSIPSESVEGQKYFVIPVAETCTCSWHCSSCNCCPHMYQCSCVDFAVHATVCKHVHTVHDLISRSVTEHSTEIIFMSTTSPDETDSGPEVDETGKDIEDSVTNPSQARCRLLLDKLLSGCRQVMAMATSGDYSDEVMAAAEKHVSAAKSIFNVACLAKPTPLAVTRKLASNKKLDKQIRFRSARVKRRPLHSIIKKPNANQIATVRGALLAKTTGADLNLSEATFEFFDGASCGEVPYCIDTEDVLLS